MNQPGVGRHLAAGGELDDVPRDQADGIDDLQMSVSNDGRVRDVEREQCFDGAPGAQLGDHAEDRVDEQYGADRRRLDPIPEEQRDDDRAQEQEHDHASKLAGDDFSERGGLLQGELVRSVPGQPCRGVGGGESRRRRAQRGEGLLDGQRVPPRAVWIGAITGHRARRPPRGTCLCRPASAVPGQARATV